MTLTSSANTNIAGEFWYIAAVRRTGVHPVIPPGDARFHEVQTMHRAEVSMVVCAKAPLNVAQA